jgi:hypothetical protein
MAAALRQAMMAPDTAVVPLCLLTITHPSLAVPIRLCNDAVSAVSGVTNVVRGGQTYVAYPFDIVLPSDTDEGPPRARLTVDNVAREIVQLVRSAAPAPEVTIDIVNAAAPDDAAATFGPFKFGTPEYDDYQVTTDLVIADNTLEPYPYKRYSAEHFPALYRQLS